MKTRDSFLPRDRDRAGCFNRHYLSSPQSARGRRPWLHCAGAEAEAQGQEPEMARPLHSWDHPGLPDPGLVSLPHPSHVQAQNQGSLAVPPPSGRQ